MQCVIAHRTQVDRVDVLGGDGRHHLEGIGWRLLLLSAQFATGGTWAHLAQLAIVIEAFVPIVPEHAHRALIVALDLHWVERFTGVSHGGSSPSLKPSPRGRGSKTYLTYALAYSLPTRCRGGCRVCRGGFFNFQDIGPRGK